MRTYSMGSLNLSLSVIQNLPLKLVRIRIAYARILYIIVGNISAIVPYRFISVVTLLRIAIVI